MPVVASTTESVANEEILIRIEVDTVPQITSPYGDTLDAADTLQKVGDLFGQGLALVKNCARSTVSAIQSIEKSALPDEFELQLAVKLDSEVGAVIAKAGAEAQLRVTMKWELK